MVVVATVVVRSGGRNNVIVATVNKERENKTLL
jgi:hypothetical protein